MELYESRDIYDELSDKYDILKQRYVDLICDKTATITIAEHDRRMIEARGNAAVADMQSSYQNGYDDGYDNGYTQGSDAAVQEMKELLDSF